MPLTTSYFEPFDRTYQMVTARVEAYAKTLEPDKKEWLETLISGFSAERKKWSKNGDLDEYRKEWERLGPLFLRLAAGAYLHISYDLPRVIADQWPSPFTSPTSPNELAAEEIFFHLDNLFPDIFDIVARQRRVTGLLAFIAKPLPTRVLEAMSSWVIALRAHARLGQPDRFSPCRMAEMLRVDKIGREVRC
jgi:hypothetical protein